MYGSSSAHTLRRFGRGWCSNYFRGIILTNGIRFFKCCRMVFVIILYLYLSSTTIILISYTMIHAVWHDRNIRRMGEHPMIWSRLLSSIDEQVRNKITAIQRTRGKWHENAMSVWFGTRWLSFHFPHSIVCFKSVFFSNSFHCI